MDAKTFLNPQKCVTPPSLSTWLWALLETALGIFLLCIAVQSVLKRGPLVAGWIGMAGIILTLHFGLFQVVALFWQQLGVAAEPIMRPPYVLPHLESFGESAGISASVNLPTG